MTTFPNIEKLGLEVFTAYFESVRRDCLAVRASDLEALLAKAIQVYKQPKDYCKWEGGASASETASHKALLVAIEPIKRETAEDVLRELVRPVFGNEVLNCIPDELLERARRVLDGK